MWNVESGNVKSDLEQMGQGYPTAVTWVGGDGFLGTEAMEMGKGSCVGGTMRD